MGRIIEETVPAAVPLAGQPFPGTVKFLYDSDEPFLITMTVAINVHPKPITVQFARELLDAALTHQGKSYGMGDVIIEHVGERTMRFLLAYDGAQDGARINLLVQEPGVIHFMLQTFMVVPANSETINFDGELAALLGGAA